MFSVSAMAAQAKQPNGGYLPVSLFRTIEYDDGNTTPSISAEYAGAVGTVVDYITRFAMTEDKQTAFSVSLAGAEKVAHRTDAIRLLDKITGLNEPSLCAAFELVKYDVAFRQGAAAFIPTEAKAPPKEVLLATAIMIQRTIAFFHTYEMPVLNGFTMDGGYSRLVSSGDGDYVTETTLLDMKCTSGNLNSHWTLQLLMYYIMGYHSRNRSYFYKLDRLGFFNPYKNIFFYYDIDDIPNEILYKVSRDVIGYKMDYSTYSYELTQKEIQKAYNHWYSVEVNNSDAVRDWYIKSFKQTNFKLSDYEDGIHLISVDDYWTYMQQSGTNRNSRPLFPYTKAVQMIKHGGFVMFLSQSSTGGLSVLNGAKTIRATHRPQYYFEHMVEYANQILAWFSPYWDKMKQISDGLKELIPTSEVMYADHCASVRRANEEGRSTELVSYGDYISEITYGGLTRYQCDVSFYARRLGRVHGCVIDISSFSHIYVNPYNGKEIPYSAYDIKKRKVWREGVKELIAYDKPLLLEGNDEKALTTNTTNCALAIVSNMNEEAIKEFETGNGIYKISKKLMGLQSIYEHKVICTWYDKVLAFIGQNNIGNEEINDILDLVEFDGTEEYRKNATRTFSLVGAKKRMNCGMMATVIADNGFYDIAVRFEDGSVVYHKRRDKFKAGSIRPPK